MCLRASAGNCSSSTGPPDIASPRISRLSTSFAQSNGSIESRPLNTHVNAKMPKKAPEM
ncbi:hypothetical protein D3C83_49140 [compost metagenome]